METSQTFNSTQFLRYNTTGAVPIVQSQYVKRANNCNGFTAINTGDDPVTVNDQILYPGIPGTTLGDSMSVGGNAGEIYLGQIKVTFSGIGANPQCQIVQKFYILDKTVI